MARKKIISLAMTALLAVSSMWNVSPAFYEGIVVNAKVEPQKEVVADAGEVNASSYGLCDNIQDGTILHCFDWKYSQIKEELPNIAAAGFTSVQTSPAQKGDGDIWYWLYQPQTFSIQPNALGTKSELQALCDEAEKYGINVIVDVVANHTRAIGDDGLGSDCYHNDGDAWYTDRYGITHGRIGMPDLNSEHSTVQNKVKGYIEELKGVGVDGIRWDAAKHISLPSENCQFWPAVTSVGLYNYGEILVGPLESGGEGLMKEYTNYMSVTDSVYGKNVREAFENGGVPGSIGNWSERGVAKNKLVYWGESHDTYSNNGEYGEATQFIDQNKIDRAYAIVAGQGKATSLYFSRPYETNKQSIKAGQKGSTHFSSKEIAAVNHLHNACAGEKDYYVNGGSAAAVCRETGAVIVKGSGSGDVSIENGGGTTAPGTYKDEITGNTWTVTANTISGSVGDSGIAVIYKGANSGGSSGGSTGGSTSVTTKAPNVDTSTSATANTIVAKKPSGWSEFYIYAYEPGTTPKKLTGEWPGTKLIADSNGTCTYTMDSSVTSAKIIFASGPSGSQDPQDVLGQSCGYDYVGGKAYSYNGSKWSEIPVSSSSSSSSSSKATTKPTATPKATATATPKVTATAKATKTPTPDNSNNSSSVTVSVKDGSSFTDETLDVKLTLKGATNGTYTVDDGPRKSFSSGDKVTLGQGKIADSDVTLKVIVNGEESTFTYHKKFDASNTLVKTSAIAKIQNIFEVIAEVSENSLNASPGASYYATNPNGQTGSKKTISGASDFTEDMIIAQGAANDNISIFRGSHEGPVYDTYALFGAYDDTNVYLGIQYTNVIDVTDPAQGYPQSDNGKPNNGDIPQMFVFDTGTGDYTDGSTNSAEQSTVWNSNIKFSGATQVDKVFMYSAKAEVNNTAWFPVSGGKIDYDNSISSKTPGTGDAGITYKYEDGFFCSSMNGVNGNGYSGYKPADLESDSANWVDFLTTSHSTTQDTFMTMTIPLSTLGVSASDIESNGIGVMSISTFGASGIGSLPMDTCMVDIASEPYSKDDSTSAEKEDVDEVTAALARLGGKAGSSGTITKPAKTVAPKETETPKEEEDNSKDEAIKETEKPTATPKEEEDNKTAIEEPEIPAGASDVYTVNFGADRSSPQLYGNALTLKAIAYGSSGYKYQFSVDGKIVQISSNKNTYKWKGKVGTHTIKVMVTDANGKKITCEKKYVIEKEGGSDLTIETEKVTEKPSVTPTKKPTETKTPTAAEEGTNLSATPKPNMSTGSENTLSVKLSVKLSPPRKAGTTIPVTVKGVGGTTPYVVYEVYVQNENGKKTKILSNSVKNTVNWKPTKAGVYKITGTVMDANMQRVSVTKEYKILSPISIKKFKVSKSKIKAGKTLKVTAKGSSTSTVKYQFKVQEIGSKKATVIRKYSKKTSVSWKTKKKGKYYVILQVKDANGNVKSTKTKLTVK